jgi:hypothetical protein
LEQLPNGLTLNRERRVNKLAPSRQFTLATRRLRRFDRQLTCVREVIPVQPVHRATDPQY